MSQIDFSGVDFTGLANLNLGDLRDSQGRYPMDPGYDPAPSQAELQASSDALYNYRNSLLTPSVATGEAPVVKPTETAEEKATRLQNEREDAQAETARLNRRKDARSSMNAVLSAYGLSDLSEYVYNEIIVKETVNINNPDAIIFAIREQPAYQKRFSANAVRVKNGFDELDPASYIALEDQYRATLSANGMPVSFYDSKDDFDAMIGGSVSNAELQSRIQDGYRAVQDADPEVKRQMQELYGVSEGDLAAYFIDPNRMKPLLVAADYKRQAQAAKIAARGSELAGIQLTGGLAEDLARRGITETEAETGFTAIGKLGELTTQMSGEAALSQEQIVGQQFGTDVAAAQELDKRKRRRVGEFAGGGSFARTQGETSGATRLSVGKAE
jgi:hypothetical protein